MFEAILNEQVTVQVVWKGKVIICEVMKAGDVPLGNRQALIEHIATRSKQEESVKPNPYAKLPGFTTVNHGA